MNQPFDSPSLLTAPRLYLLAGVLLLLTGAAFAIDLPVARFCSQETSLPGDVRRIVNFSEVFAHGFGVILVMIGIAVLDPARRNTVGRLAACAFGAGLLVHPIKIMISRTRPLAAELPKSIFDSFLGIAPWRTAENWSEAIDHSIQSFPSGHTATAFGLALAMTHIYPRGRYLFLSIAALAAMQRVVSGAHYVSDCFAGAAVACLVVGICLDNRLLGALFDRLESIASITKSNREDDNINVTRAA